MVHAQGHTFLDTMGVEELRRARQLLFTKPSVKDAGYSFDILDDDEDEEDEEAGEGDDSGFGYS